MRTAFVSQCTQADLSYWNSSAWREKKIIAERKTFPLLLSYLVESFICWPCMCIFIWPAAASSELVRHGRKSIARRGSWPHTRQPPERESTKKAMVCTPSPTPLARCLFTPKGFQLETTQMRALDSSTMRPPPILFQHLIILNRKHHKLYHTSKYWCF